MNTKSNLADVQENINLARGPASPRATLNNLAGYMTAAGYNPDHPWCIEIATALSAAEGADKSIEHALAAVNAADLGASSIDELTTFLETISALARGCTGTKGSAVETLAAIQRISRLACQFASDRKETYGCVRDDLEQSLAALKGGAQ